MSTTTGRTFRRRLSRTLRTAVLGVVLVVSALVVPDSAVTPAQVTLVKLHHGSGVDLSPDVVWILAVGSDARPGEDMTRTRGDALQLIGMNTDTGAATAIGIPRDSWVNIPGYGSNRVNAALYFGGPELLGETVGDLVGIQPDYVFVTRFKFFIAMMRHIGDITVDNPVSFSDEYLMAQGFRSGRIRLGPYEAFAFARIRHNLLRGDFDRSANQQRVIRGIQANVRAHADERGFIEGGVLTVMKYMYTDLPPAELFRLGQAMAHVDPSKISMCVVQGSIGNVGGASVVLPYVDQARRYGDAARTDATLGRC